MSYYLAPSLAQLRAEINARWPGRDRTSDGWIGDASHSARASDHNPDYASGGVVRALDVDEDGIDTAAVLLAVIHDPRVSYVIYEGRIWGGTFWRPYTGPNPHEHHFHVSIKHTRAAEDGGSWDIPTLKPASPNKPIPKEWSDMASEKEVERASKRGALAAIRQAFGEKPTLKGSAAKQFDGNFSRDDLLGYAARSNFTQLSAKDIAAQIPAVQAQDVIDELAKRLK